jgi:hypothetical protein
MTSRYNYALCRSVTSRCPSAVTSVHCFPHLSFPFPSFPYLFILLLRLPCTLHLYPFYAHLPSPHLPSLLIISPLSLIRSGGVQLTYRSPEGDVRIERHRVHGETSLHKRRQRRRRRRGWRRQGRKVHGKPNATKSQPSSTAPLPPRTDSIPPLSAT